MFGLLKNSRVHLAAALAVCLLCATAASAEQYAEVGYVYPDGTVQLDLSRFTQSISTSPDTSLSVGETLLEISNGLLYAVRLAEDACTSERVQLQTGYPTEEGFAFTPLAAAPNLGNGWHANGTQVASSSNPGLVFVTATVAINWRLFECVNDGCRERYDGACVELSNDNSFSCACVYVVPSNPFDPPDPFDLPELEMTNYGCKRQIKFRHWWDLTHIVHPFHIQN